MKSFVLQKEQYVKEVNGTVKIYSHSKTNGQVVVVKNDDKEKAFNIAFRTLPQNDTGVPHILEHSVLCGSEKYPTKEPFVELLKGSLNSFLNAETFSDKTMYPIASTNDKDFYNQVGVYLDAVFYPNLKKDPLILKQEGWHYEYDGEKLSYNGVVYNEMKGAFAHPHRVINLASSSKLFDNVYGVCSGGVPQAIPNLTQQDFCAFHDKYYQPSNSVVCLYGDLDEQSLLGLVDSYFDRFEKVDAERIVPTKPIGKLVKVDTEYEIAPTEDEKTKAMFSLDYVCGHVSDSLLTRSMSIISRMLSSDASPLKNAILQSGIAQNVSISFDDYSLQPVFSIIAEGCNEENWEKFVEIVNNCLENLAKGIDEKLLLASLNQEEFALKEGRGFGFSKGIMITHTVNNAVLFDLDPIDALTYDDYIEKLRKLSKEGWFEKLLKDCIIDCNHSTLTVLHPKKGLSQLKAQKEAEQLAKFKESLSKEQLDEILADLKALKTKQSTPDTQEALNSIPRLKVDEIDKKATSYHFNKVNDKLLWLDHFSNGIAYVHFHFSLKKVEVELLPYVGLLSALLTKVDTQKYNFLQLTNEIDIATGGISATANFYGHKNGDFSPVFEVATSCTQEKVKDAFDLIGEVASSKFDNVERIKQILAMEVNRTKMMAMNAGHAWSVRRVSSYYSKNGYCADLAKGVGYTLFVQKLLADFDNNASDIVEKLTNICQKIFSKDNLMVTVCGLQDVKDQVEKHIGAFEKRLFEKSCDLVWTVQPTAKNEAFGCPAQVQYNALGFDTKQLGFEMKGSWRVVAKILYASYLWNKVRVLGGAYGGMIMIDSLGNVNFASYRDPQLKNTYDVYKGVAQYLREFDEPQEELDKNIIGAISDLDSTETPSSAHNQAISYHYAGTSAQDVQTIRDQLLATTKEEIRQLGDVFEKVVEQNCICTIGNSQKIAENKEMFKEIKEIC
ncbi:MAG: insulinase family protein [Clostridia bacterium]|nr:insulinase family protein [Clostridia bacterium]